MEIKKTPEADLEKGRITFFLMGFAVALSGFFVLLEWQSSETDTSDWETLGPVFIENEFEGGIKTEESESGSIAPPEISKPEIVYEDYVIADDVPVVKEDTAIAFSHSKSDEKPITPVKNETVIPNETDTDTVTAASTEVLPQFPGGQTALIRFIYENIRYPSTALKQRIEGRVWCSFIVEPDGSVSNVQLEKGVYIFLDEEAVRVLKNMPAWIPGRTKGENVAIKVYIPIVFKR
ncbi:MAG: TonB family protein [Candidatus Azobacteroides sp.]|nr:TonB family protein [Candidatus Azobacteroides sp.]